MKRKMYMLKLVYNADTNRRLKFGNLPDPEEHQNEENSLPEMLDKNQTSEPFAGKFVPKNP